MATPFDVLVPAVQSATMRLTQTVRRMDNALASSASLLPGWTRGHVLSHLARCADASTAILAATLIGIEAPGCPDSHHHTACITAGARRPVTDQLADLEASARRLNAAFAAMPPRAWSYDVRLATGEIVPASWLVGARLREVELHHVDLDLGYAPSDWAEAFTRQLLPAVVSDLDARVAGPLHLRADDLREEYRIEPAGRGGEGVPAVTTAAATVTGPGYALTSWLTGRPTSEPLVVSPAGPLPQLPTWR